MATAQPIHFSSADQFISSYYVTAERKYDSWKGPRISLENQNRERVELSYPAVKRICCSLFAQEMKKEGNRGGLAGRIVDVFAQEILDQEREDLKIYRDLHAKRIIQRIVAWVRHFFAAHIRCGDASFRKMQNAASLRSTQWLSDLPRQDPDDFTDFLRGESIITLLHSLPSHTGVELNSHIDRNPLRFSHDKEAIWYLKAVSEISSKYLNALAEKKSFSFLPELVSQMSKKKIRHPLHKTIHGDSISSHLSMIIQQANGLSTLPPDQRRKILEALIPQEFYEPSGNPLNRLEIKKRIEKMFGSHLEEEKEFFLRNYSDPIQILHLLEKRATDTEFREVQWQISSGVKLFLRKEDMERRWYDILAAIENAQSLSELTLFDREYEEMADPMNAKELRELFRVVKNNPRIDTVELNKHYENTVECRAVVEELGWLLTQRRKFYAKRFH